MKTKGKENPEEKREDPVETVELELKKLKLHKKRKSLSGEEAILIVPSKLRTQVVEVLKALIKHLREVGIKEKNARIAFNGLDAFIAACSNCVIDLEFSRQFPLRRRLAEKFRPFQDTPDGIIPEKFYRKVYSFLRDVEEIFSQNYRIPE